MNSFTVLFSFATLQEGFEFFDQQRIKHLFVRVNIFKGIGDCSQRHGLARNVSDGKCSVIHSYRSLLIELLIVPFQNLLMKLLQRGEEQCSASGDLALFFTKSNALVLALVEHHCLSPFSFRLRNTLQQHR